MTSLVTCAMIHLMSLMLTTMSPDFPLGGTSAQTRNACWRIWICCKVRGKAQQEVVRHRTKHLIHLLNQFGHVRKPCFTGLEVKWIIWRAYIGAAQLLSCNAHGDSDARAYFWSEAWQRLPWFLMCAQIGSNQSESHASSRCTSQVTLDDRTRSEPPAERDIEEWMSSERNLGCVSVSCSRHVVICECCTGCA